MAEEKLRDQLTKVMAQRRKRSSEETAEIEKEIETESEEGQRAMLSEAEASSAEQPNEEWKTFFEAVSTYVKKMRD